MTETPLIRPSCVLSPQTHSPLPCPVFEDFNPLLFPFCGRLVLQPKSSGGWDGPRFRGLAADGLTKPPSPAEDGPPPPVVPGAPGCPPSCSPISPNLLPLCAVAGRVSSVAPEQPSQTLPPGAGGQESRGPSRLSAILLDVQGGTPRWHASCCPEPTSPSSSKCYWILITVCAPFSK